MEATLGSIMYYIKTNNAEFKQKMGEVRSTLNDSKKHFNDARTHLQNYGKAFTDNIKKVNEWTQKNKEAVQSVAIVSGAALAGLVLEVKKATKENIELQNSLTGLRSVARGTGQDLAATTQAAKSLAADGLMTVAETATSLKNLLSAGFNLEESINLMKHFKDIAAFNRQSSLGFGEAIAKATEGVRNQNPVLVDNIGLSKNLTKIMTEAGYSEQALADIKSNHNVKMALYNGLMKENIETTGDAIKLAEMFGGSLARVEANTKKLHAAIGDSVEGPLTGFFNKINDIIVKTTEWIEENKDLVGTLTLLATGTAATVFGGSALLLSLDKIIKVVKTARALFLDLDVIFAVRWVASGGKAAEAIGLLAKSFTPFLIHGSIIVGLAAVVYWLQKIRNEQDLIRKDAQTITEEAELQRKIKLQDEQLRIAKANVIASYGAEAFDKNGQLTGDVLKTQSSIVKDYIKARDDYNAAVKRSHYLSQSKLGSSKSTTQPEPSSWTPVGATLEDQNRLLAQLNIERLERLKQYQKAEIEEEKLRYKEELELAGSNAKLIEEVEKSHIDRLNAINEKYAEQERLRNQELADEIVEMTGTKEEQEKLYLQRREESLRKAGYTEMQIQDWVSAYHKQKLQEQTAYEADWIASIITRQRTLKDWWRELMNNLVREYVQNFLLKIKAANASTGGDNFWGALIGALGSLFGGGGSGLGSTDLATGSTWNVASRGMIVPAASNGMILPPSFGTDTVLSALTPREMVLPVDISEGLQQMIRQGSQPQNVTNNITNNYIDAIDQQSVAQFFYKNRDQVVGIVNDNQRRGGVLRRSDDE